MAAACAAGSAAAEQASRLKERVLAQGAQLAYSARALGAAKAEAEAGRADAAAVRAELLSAQEAAEKVAARDAEAAARVSELQHDMAAHVVTSQFQEVASCPSPNTCNPRTLQPSCTGTMMICVVCNMQAQVQVLRSDNRRLAQEAAADQKFQAVVAKELEAALQRQQAQHAEQAAKLQARLEEGKGQLARAREQFAEARGERDFFMAQAAEAAEKAQVHGPCGKPLLHALANEVTV